MGLVNKAALGEGAVPALGDLKGALSQLQKMADNIKSA